MEGLVYYHGAVTTALVTSSLFFSYPSLQLFPHDPSSLLYLLFSFIWPSLLSSKEQLNTLFTPSIPWWPQAAPPFNGGTDLIFYFDLSNLITIIVKPIYNLQGFKT